MNKPRSIESEISVNGVAVDYTTLPRFGKSAIVLNNLDIRHPARTLIKNKGPHFTIGYKTEDLLGCFAKRHIGYAEFSRVGGQLGYIDELAGYPAADSGPGTRYIIEYTFRCYFADDCVDFVIDGFAGGEYELKPKFNEKAYNFCIWFRISIGDLVHVFSDELHNELPIA